MPEENNANEDQQPEEAYGHEFEPSEDEAKAEDIDRLAESIDEEDFLEDQGQLNDLQEDTPRSRQGYSDIELFEIGKELPTSHMRPVNAPYKYQLLSHEAPMKNDPQDLLFPRYEPVNEGKELRLLHNGTTNEALLEVLDNRIEKQQRIVSDIYSQAVLYHLKICRALLDLRTKERAKRGVEGTHQE